MGDRSSTKAGSEIIDPGANMSEKTRVRRHRIPIRREIDVPFISYPIQSNVCTTWAQICGDIVTIRYQPDIYPGDQLIVGQDVYEITAVADRLEKTRLVELHVKEIRASADMPDAQQR